MPQDLTTIARPYAQAVLTRALETDSLEKWDAQLSFLAAVVSDEAMADLIANPAIDHATKQELLLDLGKDALDEEGANLVRLLVENGRLLLVPEISSLFQQLKREQQGVVEIEVTSAYVLKPASGKALARALSEKLGREVHLTATKDPSLIAGVRIRAGDMVIDGSVAGQLSQLANELGI